MADAELIRCPQLPTTLPTLDELIGRDGITPDTVAASILALTTYTDGPAPVFTLHAELEGMKLLPQFEQLLAGWRAQGWQLTGTRAIFESLDIDTLPRHEVLYGEVPGRSGTLMLQGQEFLKNL